MFVEIAIVTGASSGIGREFARQIDALREVDEIWLVARRAQRLDETSKLLVTKTRLFPADLTDRRRIDEIVAAVKASGARVRYLVNAAGMGKFGDYAEIREEDVTTMIRLNVEATVALTNAVLPYVKKGGKIFQMSSASAFLPLMNFAVYSASKAFVLHYALALGEELKTRRIKVVAVCPGWVDTEFAACAYNGGDVKRSKRLRPMTSAERVVKKAMLDCCRGKRVSVCGTYWKVARIACKLLPMRASMHVWRKKQKKI